MNGFHHQRWINWKTVRKYILWILNMYNVHPISIKLLSKFVLYCRLYFQWKVTKEKWSISYFRQQFSKNEIDPFMSSSLQKVELLNLLTKMHFSSTYEKIGLVFCKNPWRIDMNVLWRFEWYWRQKCNLTFSVYLSAHEYVLMKNHLVVHQLLAKA